MWEMWPLVLFGVVIVGAFAGFVWLLRPHRGTQKSPRYDSPYARIDRAHNLLH